MPAIYEHPHTVGSDEIDPQGHANNVAYVQWLQSAAVAHSAAQGWPISPATRASLRRRLRWATTAM